MLIGFLLIKNLSVSCALNEHLMFGAFLIECLIVLSVS